MTKPRRPKSWDRPGKRGQTASTPDLKAPQVDPWDRLDMPDTFPYKPQLGGPW